MGRYTAIAILLFLGMLTYAHAQECEKPPQQITTNVEEELKLSANLLKRWVLALNFENLSKKEQNDVFHKYQNADSMVLKLHYIYIFCTIIKTSTDFNTPQKIDALYRFISTISNPPFPPPPPSQSIESKKKQSNIIKSLKDSASALVKDAKRGEGGHIPDHDGRSMIEQYNLLLRKAKFLEDPFIQAWEEIGDESDGNVAARKVVILAGGLEVYLESSSVTESLKSSALALGKNAKRGQGGHIPAHDGNSMVGTYNLLVRITKSAYKHHPFSKRIEEVREESNGNVAAGKVGRLAQELHDFLPSLDG